MQKQPDITESTKAHILDAFWELYKEQPFEKISASAVAVKANVHRSTFYRYFTDIQNVLEEFENDLLEKIENDGLYNLPQFVTAIRNMPSEEAMEKGDELISNLLMKYSEKIYYLTNSHGDSKFKDKFYNWLRQQVLDATSPTPVSMEFDYIFTLIFTIMITNSNYCYEHRTECNPKTFTTLSRRIVKSCAELLY